jgi:hypothetical protein
MDVAKKDMQKRFPPGKEVGMTDYEINTIILMVLGLVIMGNDCKRK